MTIREFCDGIKLMPEAVDVLAKRQKTAEEHPEVYQKFLELFRTNREEFYNEVKKRTDDYEWFLFLYCSMACDAYKAYQARGIEEKIYWDTFLDITLWCGNCYEEFGRYGIEQYGWFWRHVDLTIFRLGRLEFEELTIQKEIKREQESIIKEGESVINVHIPQGEPLDMTLCLRSFAQAQQFFDKELPYICYSWLLYPGLKDIMKPDSNILKFQELFEVLGVDYEHRGAEGRIFGKRMQDITQYPEDTSLQKAAKQYLIEGHQLGDGIGIYKKQ